jgi:hypothetical protein
MYRLPRVLGGLGLFLMSYGLGLTYVSPMFGMSHGFGLTTSALCLVIPWDIVHDVRGITSSERNKASYKGSILTISE